MMTDGSHDRKTLVRKPAECGDGKRDRSVAHNYPTVADDDMSKTVPASTVCPSDRNACRSTPRAPVRRPGAVGSAGVPCRPVRVSLSLPVDSGLRSRPHGVSPASVSPGRRRRPIRFEPIGIVDKVLENRANRAASGSFLVACLHRDTHSHQLSPHRLLVFSCL